MRIERLFFRLAISGFAIICVPRAVAAEDFLRQGIDAYQRGKYTEAVGYFGAAKGTNAENPLLHYYMGHSLVQLKAPADALREYKIARDLSPGSKIATYCDAAIATLEKASAASLPHVFQTKPAEARVRLPQVICFLCSCKMCAQMQPMIDRLYAQHKKYVAFVWIAKDATDDKSKKLIQKYELALHPTILLLNEYGVMTKRFHEFVNTEQVKQEVGFLSVAGQSVPPADADDRILAEYRRAQMDDVYVRIQQAEAIANAQKQTIEDSVSAQMSSLIRPRSSAFDCTALRQEYEEQRKKLQEEGEKKKDELTAASMHRRMELFANAEQNIDKEEERLNHLSQKRKDSGSAVPVRPKTKI